MTSVDALTGKPRILVFCRPYLVEDFKTNLAPIADQFTIRFLTDGHSPGVTDTRARFYKRLNKAAAPATFSTEDESDVIERCRVLRNLPRPQSISMLRAMAAVLAEEVDSFNPAMVLSHMVDDYVTHLLAEIARRRGIIYLGYAYSYFPQRIQLTRYANGQPFHAREPSDAEVSQTLETILQPRFRQNYLQPETYSPVRHLRAILRYRVKQLVFSYRRLAQRDHLHYHYICLPFIVERRRWRDFPSASDFHSNWLQRLDSARQPGNRLPLVYFPLAYFPESTIDYWIEDRRVLDYENIVVQICRVLGTQFRVVVKEHMHMLGARSPSFYRILRDTPGVISVPPLEFSNQVLGLADLVLLGAGSIGVEASVRGRPIASFCRRSYWFSASRATYVSLADLQSWPALLREEIATHVEPTPQERFEFVRECLRSTLREERPGKRWPMCHPGDLLNALRIATAGTSASGEVNRRMSERRAHAT